MRRCVTRYRCVCCGELHTTTDLLGIDTTEFGPDEVLTIEQRKAASCPFCDGHVEPASVFEEVQ